MVNKKDNVMRFNKAFKRLAAVLLLLMLAFVYASPDYVYAAKAKEKEEPIRAVHNVGVGKGSYCFFVTHNVVLTPAEVAEMSDEELTAAIIERAGLYMKKANCEKPKHKEISVKSWEKNNGGFLLSESDIAGIRAAEPVDGDPVKFYMDLLVVTDMEAYEKSKESAEPEEGEDTEDADDADDSEDEEVPVYSTFKRTSPRLLFAVVATEEDAKYGEEICSWETKNKNKNKSTPSMPSGKSDEPAEEMLPEYRTINMVDRSGEPIEDTLEDGSPVNLEWIEPKDIGTDEKPSIFDRIPGGVAGLAIMVVVAAAAVAWLVAAAKRRKENE